MHFQELLHNGKLASRVFDERFIGNCDATSWSVFAEGQRSFGAGSPGSASRPKIFGPRGKAANARCVLNMLLGISASDINHRVNYSPCIAKNVYEFGAREHLRKYVRDQAIM